MLPSLSSTFPTYLMSPTSLTSTGPVVFQANVFGPGSLTVAGGDISLAGLNNTYTGGTIVSDGHSRTARAIGIAERTPNVRAS